MSYALVNISLNNSLKQVNLFIMTALNIAHTRPALATDMTSAKGLALACAIAMALGIALACVMGSGMTTVLHMGIALAWDMGHGTWTRT